VKFVPYDIKKKRGRKPKADKTSATTLMAGAALPRPSS
jgi:hypothetical protein